MYRKVLRGILAKIEPLSGSSPAEGPSSPPPPNPKCRPLPPEMWQLILTEQLQDPQDLYNCSKVSKMWAAFLEDDMDAILFHLVFLKILKYLKTNDVLNCSRVSHSWNKAVDATISTLIDDPIPDHMDRTRQHYVKLIDNLSLSFGSYQKLNDFITTKFPQYPLGAPVNPIIYRKVTLHLNNQDPQELIQYVMRLKDVFTICGSFFQQLELHIRGFEYAPDKLLRTFVESAPNLHGIKICGFPSKTFNVENENILPPLNYLKSLSIDFKCPQLTAMLLKSYGHQLSNSSLQQVTISLDEMVSFAELKTLKLDLVKESCMIFYSQLFGNGACQVTTLSLQISLKERCGPTYAASLVQLINSFGTSLETLNITSCVPPQLLEPNQLTALKLEKIKSLNFSGMTIPNMDFLKGFASTLETLVVGGCQLNEEVGNNVAFYTHLYDEHGFWKKMKKVKMVRLDVAVLVQPEVMEGSGEDEYERNISGYKAEQRTFQYTRDIYEMKHLNSRNFKCCLQ